MPVTAADFVGRRILVVENDPAMRPAFGMLLGAWGMEVAEAAGVAEALAAVREGAVPDVVLTDYRLDDAGDRHPRHRGDPRRPRRAGARRRSSAPRAPRRSAGSPIRSGCRCSEKPVAEGELRRVLHALLEGLA